ncbi:DUF6153 family protein [Streptomyces sp. NPDC005435]|uniref:DUF6153 family protein n=1 Tax=Streptomyces sp. NPDC005435 TaxID=3154464 RepID=UPI003454321B
MSRTRQRTPAPPPWRLLVLLVLGGLLAMHGLAPGGGLGPVQRATAPHMSFALSAPGDCGADHGHGGGHDARHGHDGGGHVHHADATCASAAVPGGPELALPASPDAIAPAPGVLAPTRALSAPDGARAPPSLAELQLLRI